MSTQTGMVFRQRAGGTLSGFAYSGAEGYLLQSLEPKGEAAELVIDGQFSDGGFSDTHEYAGRLVQDSGPFKGNAPVIMLVGFNVPEEAREEVDRWYVEEHIPLLMRAPGWMRARRYDVIDRGAGSRPFTSLAFHQLSDVSVLDSAERAYARSTPWRARLEADGSWFGEAGRWVYKCVRDN